MGAAFGDGLVKRGGPMTMAGEEVSEKLVVKVDMVW